MTDPTPREGLPTAEQCAAWCEYTMQHGTDVDAGAWLARTAALLRQLSLDPMGSVDTRGELAQVRRYSVEENYSEVIEDGAVWVRASDYDALADECARLNYLQGLAADHYEQYKADLPTLRAELSRLQAALGAAEADARRYRWLRDPINDGCDVLIHSDIDGVTHGWHSLLGDELDDAIDAALASQELAAP